MVLWNLSVSSDELGSFVHKPQATADGNFQQNQKAKNFDQKDAPLTMGAAYYAHEEAFAKYQAQDAASEATETQEVCGSLVAEAFSDVGPRTLLVGTLQPWDSEGTGGTYRASSV